MDSPPINVIDSLDSLDPSLRAAVIAEVQRKVDAEHVRAVHEQTAAAAGTGEHRSMDGLGRPFLSVHPVSFHYWGQRLGYECWRDKQFLREFHRDNPAARIKSAGTKTLVGYRA